MLYLFILNLELSIPGFQVSVPVVPYFPQDLALAWHGFDIHGIIQQHRLCVKEGITVYYLSNYLSAFVTIEDIISFFFSLIGK
jgi:hypothetical protein